jgi:hypothetical protein
MHFRIGFESFSLRYLVTQVLVRPQRAPCERRRTAAFRPVSRTAESAPVPPNEEVRRGILRKGLAQYRLANRACYPVLSSGGAFPDPFDAMKSSKVAKLAASSLHAAGKPENSGRRITGP